MSQSVMRGCFFQMNIHFSFFVNSIQDYQRIPLVFSYTLRPISQSVMRDCFVQMNIHIVREEKLWQMPWVVARYQQRPERVMHRCSGSSEVQYFTKWNDYNQCWTNNPFSWLSLVQMDTTIELNNIPINKSGKLITSTEFMVSIKIM